ncbi:G-protein coupled receptor GRL101-like, partial [Limulus polyphemus]|uniref:G-protein coupled receptor GRL101-like n=1 Tax=Limulus polyphemus TaxID=6850 RepID=A0ABM1T0H4_LIMPO
ITSPREKYQVQNFHHKNKEMCFNNEEYNCMNSEVCIHEVSLCNGISECPHGDDESALICGCLTNELYCNGTCIDDIRRCDTQQDCPDGSDEENCETYICPLTHFKCDNHLCVPNDAVCDFVNDCGDLSDEHNCSYRSCWYGEYRCKNSECVREYSVCDGHRDCLDGSDEELCNPVEHFKDCADGTRAHISVWCDGWLDCPKNQADELNCRNCLPSEFQCQNTRCIRTANVCDTVCDCGDACDDEKNCESFYTVLNGVALCTSQATILCAHTNRCIRAENICDGSNDCQFGRVGADEYGCDYSTKDCVKLNNHFMCSDGRCLPEGIKCNHIRDCTGGEDESNCTLTTCGPSHFRCYNGQCIEEKYRCDAQYHCRDRSDEVDCVQEDCPDDYVKCSGGQCIRLDWWCDFRLDCPDFSDEKFCDNRRRTCNEDEFLCMNGECVSQHHRCFRTKESREGCADGSHLIGCENSTCAESQLKCSNSYCIDKSLACDGNIHCQFSWTDEVGCPFQCSLEERCPCVDITINCTNVGLTSFPKKIEHQISRFLFRGNNLSGNLQKRALMGMEKSRMMDLGRNGINYLSSGIFSNLWRLKILYLDENLLTSLQSNTFQGLGQLRSLILKGNFIQEIQPLAFSGLLSLKTFDLSHNYLVKIIDGTFNGLDQLLSLDLTHNNIVTMESRVFVGLIALKNLRTDEFRFCCLASHVDDCYPKADEFSSCEDLMSNIVLRICIWFLGVLALAGNIVVIVWRSIYRLNNKVHSFLITNLAIGDMLMGVYLLVIATVDAYYRGVYFIYASYWKHSPLCQFAGFLSTLSSELSVLTLTIITLDRFVCIIFPFRLKRLSMKQTSLIMGAVWVVVVLLAGVPLLQINYFSNFYGRSGVCLALHITPERSHGWEYSVSVFLALNFVSFAVIALAYTWMFGVAKKTQTAVRSRDSRADATMARRMTVIVATDFCCWMPIILLGVASLGGATIPPQVFAWVAVFVLPLNAAVNPLLYTLSTAPFLSPARTRVSRVRFSLMNSMTGDSQKSIIVSLPDVPVRSEHDPLPLDSNGELVPLRDLISPSPGRSVRPSVRRHLTMKSNINVHHLKSSRETLSFRRKKRSNV